MKFAIRGIFILACIVSHLISITYAQSAANAAFDFKSMGDMSDFDPANAIVPTGDTIKIAVVASFSGPAALVGQIYWASALWAAHDINKRGGIMVDGKKKFVQLRSNPSPATPADRRARAQGARGPPRFAPSRPRPRTRPS